MLKRKWIVNSQGHLVGIWTDCDQPGFTPAYLTETPKSSCDCPNPSRGLLGTPRERGAERSRPGLHPASPAARQQSSPEKRARSKISRE
jgi:hypothetical protein